MAASLPADPNVPRVSLTAGLANRFPRQADEEAAGITGANTLQMQKLAGGVSSGATTAPKNSDVAAAGAQLATSAAQQGAAAGANAGQELAGAASTQQRGTAAQTSANQNEQQLSLSEKAQSNSNRLTTLSAGVNNTLVTQNMQFQSDQVGAGVLNATQLADWTVQNSQDQQQTQDNLQTIQLAASRKLDLYKAAYQKIMDTLQDNQQLADLQKKGVTQEQLQQYAQQAKLNYLKAQAELSSTTNMITGGLTVAGGVVGGIFGGPAGAVGGSMVGQAAGGAVVGVGQSNDWFGNSGS